ncbi:MAG: glycosyltransferase family 1 protein, partial [Prolixibacteraceae bacterium]
VAEVLKHAIKVDFWDVNALADSIYGILEYPSLSRMFKKHGRVEVDSLEWKNSAEHVRNVYQYTLDLVNA